MSRTAIRLASQTISVARIHVWVPSIESPSVTRSVMSSATNVVTRPIPPIRTGALRWAVRAMNGPRTPWSTPKITTVTRKPEAVMLKSSSTRLGDDQPDCRRGQVDHDGDEEADHEEGR